MSAETTGVLDYRAMIDGLGQGVLLFDLDGRLMLDNLAARAILGPNLVLIRSEGWPAMALLLDGPRAGGPTSDELREQALRSAAPIRFQTFFAGAYTPCWISAIHSANGAICIMVTIDRPDWEALSELMTTFRNEARMSVSATRGHAELITQILRKSADDPKTQNLARQVRGFTEIIATHMFRLQNLMDLLQRLEIIRTGALAKQVRDTRTKIELSDYIEDFLEKLIDESLLDPDLDQADYRDRLTVTIPENLAVMASPAHFGNLLRDTLRNAICYSPPGSQIELKACEDKTGRTVQIDVTDQGYGIRTKEADRVFKPFQRARQPQIIAVDGYGLSLYLCKAEIEAMGGRIWFESEEGVGSTFSFKLPVARERKTG